MLLFLLYHAICLLKAWSNSEKKLALLREINSNVKFMASRTEYTVPSQLYLKH